MKHLYFFLIVSFCSSLLSCTNDDSFLAHDFETQQNRALSIYTGNYNIYQIAKKVSLPSASTTKLNSVITNCCNDYPVIKWLHNYAKDKKYNFLPKASNQLLRTGKIRSDILWQNSLIRYNRN